jgi:hypothetical protein
VLKGFLAKPFRLANYFECIPPPRNIEHLCWNDGARKGVFIRCIVFQEELRPDPPPSPRKRAA